MSQSIRDIPKKRGRKPTGGRQPGILVRMSEGEIHRLDDWAQANGLPTRPEAIRTILKEAQYMIVVRFNEIVGSDGIITHHDARMLTPPPVGSALEFNVDRQKPDKFTVVGVEYVFHVDTKKEFGDDKIDVVVSMKRR